MDFVGGSFRPLLVAASALGLGMLVSSANAAPQPDTLHRHALSLGVLGDSSSDEFRGDDARGGAYAATTLNWLELLVRYRGVDAGSWGNRPSPRRHGYEFNWALSGAKTAEAISDSAVDGLAGQVASGKVSAVVVMVGANDFAAWNGTYERVYSAGLAGDALRRSNAAIVERIQMAVEAIARAGKARIFVTTLLDRSDLPRFRTAFPDARGRRRVSDSIAQINGSLRSLTQTHGIHLVDQYAVSVRLLERLDKVGHIVVGGVAFDLASPGDEPHHLQLGDDEHLGTVGSGILANIFVDAFRSAGICIAPFGDLEILANAGVAGPGPRAGASAGAGVRPSGARAPASTRPQIGHEGGCGSKREPSSVNGGV